MQANRTRAIISRIFSFGLKKASARLRFGLAANPVQGTERPTPETAARPGAHRGAGVTPYRASVQKATRRLRRAAGVDFWPHDLRRTVASHMAGMGIPRLVISRLLNHAEPGVTKVYDRHGYDPQKRKAFEAWARDDPRQGGAPPVEVSNNANAPRCP